MESQASEQPASGDDITSFLESNGVLEEWQDFIFSKETVTQCLKNIITNDLFQRPIIPNRAKVLRALSRCEPNGVKVVILGYEPVNSETLATGFSFSFPRGHRIDGDVGNSRREALYQTGGSILRIHDVLVRAGILVSGGSYDYCHEEWADRGVLLLNASLTYDNNTGLHFQMWKDFILNLLKELVLLHKTDRLFILGWGTYANEICNKLSIFMGEQIPQAKLISHSDHDVEVKDEDRIVLYIGHHPTFPRDLNLNYFPEQAVNQFKVIENYYPGLLALPNLN